MAATDARCRTSEHLSSTRVTCRRSLSMAYSYMNTPWIARGTQKALELSEGGIAQGQLLLRGEADAHRLAR